MEEYSMTNESDSLLNPSENLRLALAWLIGDAMTAENLEEVFQRFDLSPHEEEFLLRVFAGPESEDEPDNEGEPDNQ
jgi:hypothetical protein